MDETKLQLVNIEKRFNKLTVLKNIDLYIKNGEFVSIIGPSGCGKSTLLDIIAGLLKQDSGTVFFNGKNISGKRGYVSYMPQNDVLFPWRTIIDNVIVPLEIEGVDKDQARKQAFELLPVFGLRDFAHHYPKQLSGGMRQRASFLRTYLCKKEMMLLDEPFGRLDALTRLKMQQWLLNIWQKFKQTVLLITHDIDEAIFLSDRIYVLSTRPGKVIEEVKVELERPRHTNITTSVEFSAIKSRLMNILQRTGDEDALLNF